MGSEMCIRDRPNPFPGDQFTNYGFGNGQGPALLGSQVVAREQLGSLDPATGKSLDWNPGSDSFLGGQSLTFVPERGLLVGHDGNRLGGNLIGRHAFFPLGNDAGTPAPPPPPANNGFSCVAADDGNDKVLTFSGTRGTTESLRRNGKWAGSVTGRNTQTVVNGAGDDFAVRVFGPEFDTPFSEIACSADGAGNPVGPPGGVVDLSTTITSPLSGQVVDFGNVTFTGDASAPGGIQKVRLTVVRSADGNYLNEDGTYTSRWAAIDVDLETPDEQRSWSKSVDLDQTGEYRLTAKTFANDGSKNSNVAVTFLVGSTADAAPDLEVTGPANPSTGRTAVIEGTVTDDLGVESVRFTMRDRDGALFLREDGTLGASFTFTAVLSNPGAATTNFARTLTNVPEGSFTVRVEALDSSGQRDVVSRTYSQVGNTSPPSIQLTGGADQRIGSNSRAAFAGTAQADAGIDKIEVLIRDITDFSGVSSNGNLGTLARYFVIPGTNGGTSQNWSYQSPALPPGTYDVLIRVQDNLGSLATDRTLITAGPAGDDLPSQLFTTALRYQQGVDSLSTELGGTAADDKGVSAVQLQIWDLNLRRWLQTDGTYDTTPEPFLTTLSSPGSTSTGWNFTFDAPVASTYYFYLSAVDSSGQSSLARTFGSGRIFPGDETPTVTVNSPANNQVVDNQRIAVSGSANDDVSLELVEVRIRDVGTGLYLRSDGSLGGVEWIQTALTNPGGARSNFDYITPVVPKGTWEVSVRSEDRNRQTSTTTRVLVTLN